MQQKFTVENLRTYFHTDRGVVKAVDGVSFSVESSETLGIVGESGCGKSVTALSILQLISQPPGKIESGKIFLEGRNLLTASPAELRKIRGNKISMIFQDPMTSLNPVFKVGEQVAEAIRLHQGLVKKEAFDRAVDMLRLVGIPSAGKRARGYPHQLSGGGQFGVSIIPGQNAQTST